MFTTAGDHDDVRQAAGEVTIVVDIADQHHGQFPVFRRYLGQDELLHQVVLQRVFLAYGVEEILPFFFGIFV